VWATAIATFVSLNHAAAAVTLGVFPKGKISLTFILLFNFFHKRLVVKT